MLNALVRLGGHEAVPLLYQQFLKCGFNDMTDAIPLHDAIHALISENLQRTDADMLRQVAQFQDKTFARLHDPSAVLDWSTLRRAAETELQRRGRPGAS
jgi:hypothetical protein